MRIAGSEYLKLFSNKIFLICIIAFFCADSLFFVMLQSSDYENSAISSDVGAYEQLIRECNGAEDKNAFFESKNTEIQIAQILLHNGNADVYRKKYPKLYDNAADTLRNGAASGHYYENYVVMELVKNYAYAKSKVNITYFRDSNAKEIDVFLDENNVIHPLEIKKSASPDRREVKKYSVIDKASLNRGNGGIICMCEEPIPIDKDNCFIPSNLI